MPDDEVVAELGRRVDDVVDLPAAFRQRVPGFPAGAAGPVVGVHVAERHVEAGTALAQHVPHGPDLAAAQIGEHRVGETDVRVVASVHAGMVPAFEGVVERRVQVRVRRGHSGHPLRPQPYQPNLMRPRSTPAATAAVRVSTPSFVKM